MRVAILIDLIAWAGLLAWIALSAYFWVSADSQKFQSMGVVGIAVAITYFVVQRHATPQPSHAIHLQEIHAKQLNLHESSLLSAHQSIAAIALSIEKACIDENRHVPAAITVLADAGRDALQKGFRQETSHTNEVMDSVTDNVVRANAIVLATRRNAEILQASVIVLGTLQSGLGSTLMNFVNGGGN